MALTREDFVSRSVDRYLMALLAERGYTDDVIEFLDSFPHSRFDDTPLTKTYVCIGYNFDDGGKDAEMGSNLRHCLHTIEFFVIGHTETWAKNVAQAVKYSLQHDKTVPLVDITEPDLPVIDALVVASASAEHQPVPQPKPWQEHIWTVHSRIEDTYMPSAAIE